ncbi:serine/threonine protein kinase [Anopheles sinensis]|uniref:Serine/threonine protein kinase n=1 Tax=Anopheles sinensis TaxID=74873 RepID=A0A084VR89_ANOSI|nr:serine/threonine protein kinase [Anopheles sinensis]
MAIFRPTRDLKRPGPLVAKVAKSPHRRPSAATVSAGRHMNEGNYSSEIMAKPRHSIPKGVGWFSVPCAISPEPFTREPASSDDRANVLTFSANGGGRFGAG